MKRRPKVLENRYLVGTGDDAKLKLSPEFATSALRLLFDRLDGGGSCSAREFETTFCLPMRTVESWKSSILRTYGRSAATVPAFTRILQNLQTESGRQKVCSCISARISLGGAGTSEAGIEECRALMEELKKMKAGSTATAESVKTEEPVALEDGQAAESHNSADFLSLAMEDQGAAELDPVEEKAKTLAEHELLHISAHRDEDAFKADVVHRIITEKSIVVIDAPTSKARVVHDLINKAHSILNGTPAGRNFALLVTVGRRLDLLASVVQALAAKYPKKMTYVVQITAGDSQTAMLLPTFAVVMPATEKDVLHIRR